MNQTSTVRLSDAARGVCQESVKRLKGPAAQVKRAPRLRKAEAAGPAWWDVPMAEAYACRVQTVATVRQRLVTAGLEGALERQQRSTAPTPHQSGMAAPTPR